MYRNHFNLQTIENLRNRTNVELVHKEERFIKLMSKPNLDTFQRFSDDLAAVKLLKTKLTLNRPIICGMVILDLAKVLMYDFYYNVLKKTYGDRVELLFTDTDSLCVNVKTYNVYKDMEAFADKLDCSEYPTNHDLYSKKNKKALGKFKDELCGKPMQEYVGLSSKVYSYTWPLGNVNTCKGSNLSINKNVLKLNMYYECLFCGQQRRDHMCRIGSHNHHIYTYSVDKVSLSPLDDKRYVKEDKVNTLAYGHYKILRGDVL